MHVRADACLPFNMSWAAATAFSAVMCFQSKGVRQDYCRWKGMHAVTVGKDVVFHEEPCRCMQPMAEVRLPTITWHNNKLSGWVGRGTDAVKWIEVCWHFPLTPLVCWCRMLGGKTQLKVLLQCIHSRISLLWHVYILFHPCRLHGLSSRNLLFGLWSDSVAYSDT